MPLDFSHDSLAGFLIGVIDLRKSRAVHAIAGRREAYQVIDRPWCSQGDPVELARSYFRGWPLMTAGGLYVADLDAILDGVSSPQNRIEEINRLVLRSSPEIVAGKEACLQPQLWIDSGNIEPSVVRAARKRPSASLEAASVVPRRVIGTESITDTEVFAEQFREMKSAGLPLTISLDICSGRVVSPCRAIATASPMENLGWFVELGIREFIILDLTAVGSQAGPVTVDLCERVSREFRRLQAFRLISGGGVRNESDVCRLIDAGCNGVLVASWLQGLWNEMDFAG